ncbi:MAG: hypothetical protein QXU18_09280 [Thermoplasmatales archaeon]
MKRKEERGIKNSGKRKKEVEIKCPSLEVGKTVQNQMTPITCAPSLWILLGITQITVLII